jgi:hypothetical protein
MRLLLLVGRADPVREVVLGVDGSVSAREAIRLLSLSSAGHAGAVRRVLRYTPVPVLAIGLACRRSA